MSFQFEKHSSGVIFCSAKNADRFAGGLVKWVETDDGLQPSGNSWTEFQAARLRFNFKVDTAGDYKLHIRLRTFDRDAYIWLSLDSSVEYLFNNETRNFGRAKFNESIFRNKKTDNPNFYLSAGKHHIDICSIHESIEITRISISPAANNSVPDNSTGNGGTDVNTGGEAIISNKSFIDSLHDETRKNIQGTLFEMFNAGSAVRFANKPFLSKENLAYDDGLVGDSFIEESLSTGEKIVGDITVITEPEAQPIPLHQIDFRGYNLVQKNGDLETEDFQITTTNTIKNCKRESQNQYRFELVPSTDVYQRTFYKGADVIREGTLADELDWLLDQFEGASSAKNVNVPDSAYGETVRYAVTESSTMDEILDLFVAGFNGFWRTDQKGKLELVVPDADSSPALVFNSDSIVDGSVQEVEVFSAFQTVTLVSKQKYEEDNVANAAYRISESTEALTGHFNEEKIIEVATTDLTKLAELSQIYTKRYGVPRKLYSVDVIDLGAVAVVGEYAILTSNLINTQGIIEKITRSGLSSVDTIEILI